MLSTATGGGTRARSSFQAGRAATTAGFIQAAAGASVSHLLLLRLHVCLHLQTVVSAKSNHLHLTYWIIGQLPTSLTNLGHQIPTGTRRMCII